MTARKDFRIRESLYDFHRELNVHMSGEDDMLSRGLRLIGKKISADRICVFLLDERRRELWLKFALEGGLLLEENEEIYLREGSRLLSLIGNPDKAYGVLSPHPVLFVPLHWTGSDEEIPLGLLRFENGSRNKPFGTGEKALARLLAAELAQNLQRTRVAQSRQRHLQRLEALTDLSAVFAGSLRVEDSLKLILQGIVKHFGFDRARLYLVDREKEFLRGELSVDIRGKIRPLENEAIRLDDPNHRFARMLKGDVPDGMMRHYEERVLHVPLAVSGQKIGLLVADSLLSQEPIDADDVRLLRSFAGQIALAVDNARLFEEVQELSLYDSLTGLPLRRYFNQRFQEELYRVERSREPLSLAVIDIDHFKGINDSYGHQVGDQALKRVGAVILKRLRKIDFPARFGGDEILILLPQTKAEDAAKIMERLLGDIRELRIPVPFARGGEIQLSASIGVAAFPEDARSAEELFARADEALYKVKSRGRDGIATWGQKTASEGAAERGS